MKYEVIQLEEKNLVGLTARTSNKDEKMNEIIGGMWQRFFTEGVYQSIPNKKNSLSIGLYSNYESNVDGAYDVSVCCEVTKCEEVPEGLEIQSIFPGKYAKFIVKGNMHTAVADFWTALWAMDLDRRYSCDFEEYQSGGDVENCDIHMYISIN